MGQVFYFKIFLTFIIFEKEKNNNLITVKIATQGRIWWFPSLSGVLFVDGAGAHFECLFALYSPRVCLVDRSEPLGQF